MLNLQTLKEMVEVADVKKRIPSAKQLIELGVPCVAKANLGTEIEITVYKNGYVLYQAGKNGTVFPLHSCGGYLYESVEKKADIVLKREHFDQEEWYFRLLLEGEDRVAHNQNNRIGNRCVSYSAVSEDWAPLGVDDLDLMALTEEENKSISVEQILALMTERQAYVLVKQFMEGIDQKKIAAELGISQQAVSNITQSIRKKLKKFFKTACFEGAKISG